MKTFALILISAAVVLVSGCGNPYVDPARSKALSEIEQVEEIKKQTALLERSAAADERAANALERMAKAAERQ